MSFEIRKIVSYVEETFIEGGKASDKPVTMVGLAVVLKNPWLGRGFVEDLKPEIRANCSDLGALMVERLVGIIGGAEKIEAYGKAAVVGADGEIEHASAIIHTLRFGNHYREAVKAKSYLSFTNKRGGPGTSNARAENSSDRTRTFFAPSAASSDALNAEAAQTTSAWAATDASSRRPSSSSRTTFSS